MGLVFIAVASIASHLLHYFSEMPLWGTVLIVAVALIGNSLVAEPEENRPGGTLMLLTLALKKAIAKLDMLMTHFRKPFMPLCGAGRADTRRSIQTSTG